MSAYSYSLVEPAGLNRPALISDYDEASDMLDARVRPGNVGTAVAKLCITAAIFSFWLSEVRPAQLSRETLTAHASVLTPRDTRGLTNRRPLRKQPVNFLENFRSRKQISAPEMSWTGVLCGKRPDNSVDPWPILKLVPLVANVSVSCDAATRLVTGDFSHEVVMLTNFE